jgi:hypothetical protein
VPSPAQPTPQQILQQYEAANVRLELLYEGKDPFDPEATVTPAKEDEAADPNPDDIPF